MQQRIVISNGKKFIVNVADYDEGVGSGFATGQLVLKSYTDSFWYVVTASGSAGAVAPFVSQSVLSSYGTSSYYDINYPYQLLASSDGNTYQVYLTGTAPAATLTVSQSIFFSGSFFTSSYPYSAYVETSKPYLLLQNITDSQYYKTYLVTVAGVTTFVTNQTIISSSWVHPIY